MTSLFSIECLGTVFESLVIVIGGISPVSAEAEFCLARDVSVRGVHNFAL